jgi:hypothetical protein
MLNTYCVNCGAVNHIGEQNCVGCGVNLAIQPDFATPDEPREWQPFANPNRPLPEIRSFSVGHVFSTTLKLFLGNLWLITKLVFLVFAPFEIFKVLSLSDVTDNSQRLWALPLGWLCNLLIAPALVYALMKVLETDRQPGVNESFRWGLTKLWRLAICAAISAVLQGLGYIFFVIPGIIISLTLVVVYPVAILEKGSPADVLRRSSQLTRGFRWEILGVEIVFGLLGLVTVFPVSFIVANPYSPSLAVTASIFTDILKQALTVMSLVMYLTLLRTPRQGHSMLSLTN